MLLQLVPALGTQLASNKRSIYHVATSLLDYLMEASRSNTSIMGGRGAGGLASDHGIRSSEPAGITITEFKGEAFKVDDGPIRLASESEENRRFLASLHRGEVPTELRGKSKDGLSVNYVDKRSEEPPAPPKPKFAGSGRSAGATTGGGSGGLGDEALMIGSGATAGAAQAHLDKVSSSAAAAAKVAVRLSSGKRIRLAMDPTTTVRSLLEALGKETAAGTAFKVQYGRPAKSIEGDLLDASVEAAGLVGEALI